MPEQVSSSDEVSLLETLDFFDIIHGSYQPLNFLPFVTLSMRYSIFVSMPTESWTDGQRQKLDGWRVDKYTDGQAED